MISIFFRLSNLEGLEKVGLYTCSNDLNMFQAKQFRGFGESRAIYQRSQYVSG